MPKYHQETDEQITVSVEKYIQRIAYEGQGLPEFIGISYPGAASSASTWQIRKLTYVGTNVVSILFASGNGNFDKVWNDKATYSYS